MHKLLAVTVLQPYASAIVGFNLQHHADPSEAIRDALDTEARYGPTRSYCRLFDGQDNGPLNRRCWLMPGHEGPCTPYALPGPKNGENRGWKPYPKQLQPGSWLAIHAGARMYPDMEWEDIATPNLFAGGNALWPECPAFDALPKGAIVGVAQIDRFVMHDGIKPYAGDYWMTGPVIWVLKRKLCLERPIPCKGKQGLWAVEGDALAACLARINQDQQEGTCI